MGEYFIHDYTYVQDDEFAKEMLGKLDKFDCRFKAHHSEKVVSMDPAVTYFGSRRKQQDVICQYDQVYRQKNTWNQKLHREDGQYKLAAVHMWQEEARRAVPVLGSSLYGHRPPIDTLKTTKSQRIHTVQQEFLRPRNVFPGYGI